MSIYGQIIILLASYKVVITSASLALDGVHKRLGMTCLGKLSQQWIVLGTKQCLCVVLCEGNSKKGFGRCGHGGFVVIY